MPNPNKENPLENENRPKKKELGEDEEENETFER